MWLYDGLPDGLGLNVRDATPDEGGYVVVVELANHEIRMFATRFPTRSIASWESRTRRYGGENLSRVMVSPTHPRYERVKRMLIQSLAEDHPTDVDLPTISRITKKAKAIFDNKIAELPGNRHPAMDFGRVDFSGGEHRKTVWQGKS